MMLDPKCLVVVLAVLSVGLCKYLSDSKTTRNIPRIKDIVTVNGTEYYIDTDSWLSFVYAKQDCEIRNSHLVTFPTRQKYNDFVNYLSQNELGWTWFWTDGFRPADSSRWYWSNSNTEITEFMWAPKRPEDQTLSQTRCISFNFMFGGWDDDSCDIDVVLPHVCEI